MIRSCRLGARVVVACLLTLGLGTVGARPVSATTTFVVNRTGDAADLNLFNTKCDTSSASGNQCTLRAAIQEANDTPGPDTINFNMTSRSKVIAPTSPLPPITDQVTVNGFSQPGSSANTLTVGSNAVLKIVLDGVNAGVSANGLEVAAYRALVMGLVIQRFDGSGVLLSGTKSDIVGNYIGTNAAGTLARANGVGVTVTGDQNHVGGIGPGSRNLISGNELHGVHIRGTAAAYNGVVGNYIGTNAAGTAALGNGRRGVYVEDGLRNSIGGTTADSRNVISANGERGVLINSGDQNVVSGNLIGTKADGTGDLGNVGAGVILIGASNNVIGGSASGAANVISGNGGVGLHLAGTSSSDNEARGNVVRLNDLQGVVVEGDRNLITGNIVFQNGSNGIQVEWIAFGARIVGNQIFANGGLGIDLNGGTENAFGVTANDTDDPDDGANRLQNYPVLTSSVRSNATGVTTVAGTLNSTPSTEFRIELFIAVADASGNGEGQILIATKNITTNSGGDKGFTFASGQLAPGMVLTATATPVVDGSTSEFSANRTVVAGP